MADLAGLPEPLVVLQKHGSVHDLDEHDKPKLRVLARHHLGEGRGGLLVPERRLDLLDLGGVGDDLAVHARVNSLVAGPRYSRGQVDRIGAQTRSQSGLPKLPTKYSRPAPDRPASAST